LGEAFIVSEGANEVPKRILQRAVHENGVKLTLNSTVQRITRNEQGKYTLDYITISSEGQHTSHTLADLDVVVIATPLEIANITFAGNIVLPRQNSKAMNRKTKKIHKYVVAAEQIRARALKDNEGKDEV
jgi:hypothetical protein